MTKKFYSQTLGDDMIVAGYSFGDTKVVVTEPLPFAIGFVPIPGVVVCGENLYIKTSYMFESHARATARFIAANLRGLLLLHDNNIQLAPNSGRGEQ